MRDIRSLKSARCSHCLASLKNQVSTLARMVENAGSRGNVASSSSEGCLTPKIAWSGEVVSIQPRIRLLRSFDERSLSYLGFQVCVAGRIGRLDREFTVGIGKATQATHGLEAGDHVRGLCEQVADSRREPAEYYKVARLRVTKHPVEVPMSPPPWLGIPPDLETYRARGHRRLHPRTYASKCSTCIWGCRMPVEIIVDHWNPSQVRYRHETFCYGPKSCSLYRAGATRKVPGRHGMVWEEEDWADEDATAHRGPDD